jgi:hypothetical protein
VDYLAPYLFVCVVLVLVLCATGLVWDWLLFPRSTRVADRILAATAMSFATWMAVAFILCSVHLLRRPVVSLLIVGVLAGAGLVWRSYRQSPLSLPPVPDGWLLVALIPIEAVLLALLPPTLNPLPAWDAEVYHLTVPRLYVQAHGFYRIPFNVYSNWPLNVELLFGLVLLFSDHVAAALVHYLLGIATSLAIFAGCMGSLKRSGAWVGALAVSFFWINRVTQIEATFAYVDLGTTLFFVVSFFASMYAAQREGERRTWFFISGISLGMMVGTKPNGVVSGVAAAVMALYWVLTSADRWTVLRSWLAWAAVPAGLLAIVWPIKSWLLTGNPVYPFFYDRFGGPEWSDTLSRQFEQWQAGIGMGHMLKDDLLLPVRVILDGDYDYEHFYGIASHAWIVLAPLALLLVWTHPLARICLAGAGVNFVLWAATSQQMRYLLPMFALLSMATAIGLVEATQRFLVPKWRAALPALGIAAGVLLLGCNEKTFVGARNWLGPILQYGTQLSGASIPPVYSYISEHLPDDARILLVDTNYTYFVERDFIADSFFEASQITPWLGNARTPDEVHAKLRAEHVSHLLVNEDPLGQRYGAHYPPGLLAMIGQATGVHLDYRDDTGHFRVYSVCASIPCTAESASPVVSGQ